MDRRTKKRFLLRANQKEYKERVKKSITVLDKAINEYNPYLSFSGGKDSTVMVHLALQLEPELYIWHWDYGDKLMPRDIEKEVLINLESLGATKVILNKRVGSDARTNYKYGYAQFFKQIKENNEKYGFDLGIIGVRRSESITRKNKYLNHFQDGDCYPLLDWTYEDVWAYIVSNNLPYPKVYDYYSPLVGYDNSRFVTFFDDEFETINSSLDGVLVPEYRND